MTKSLRHHLMFLAELLVCIGFCLPNLSAQPSDSLGSLTIPATSVLAPPNRLAFVQQPTNAAAGARISPPITVQLTDNKGTLLSQAGIPIAITLTSGTGVLSGTTTRSTDSAGLATFDDLSITLTGSKKLTASSLNFQSVASNNFTITAGLPTRLRIQTEPPPTATAGILFSPQPVLRVEDAAGNLVSADNSTVVTAVRLAGSGTLQGTVSATVQNGIATFANLSHNVATTISLLFTGGTLIPDTSIDVAVLPAAAAQLSFLQQPTSAPAGTSIAPPVTVTVKDAYGNNLTASGTPVTIALFSGTGTLGGTLTRNSVSGLATFDDLSIDLTGQKVLTATSGTLTSAKSDTFTVTTRPARALAFVQQPTTTAAGAPISPPVTVQVRDSIGNNVAAPGLSVNLALSSGTGTLGGPTIQMTDSSGRATFGGLSINLTGDKVLSAASPGLDPATSVSFAITPGTAAQLHFVQQPTSARAGAALTPAVSVEITDIYGNRVSSAGTPISLTLSSGTGELTGTIPQLTDASGLAAFNNLSINLAGPKTMSASSASLTPAVSDPFVISAAPPATLVFTSSPGGGTAGVPFAVQPVVTLEDLFGNPVSGVAQTISLAIQTNAGGGSLSGITRLDVDTATGRTSFTGLSIDRAGSGYTLTATGSTVSITPGSVVSNPFTITPAAASTVGVENASDGTGAILAAQNVSSGTSITVYAVARDAFHNFVGNVAADAWALLNLTGGVANTDLVASSDGKSATFTGRQTGTATIGVAAAGLNSISSGTLTVVVAQAPASISVETAPNGTGTIVPSQTLASGSKLTVYAVGRDAAGNFVGNIAADDWALQNKTGFVAEGDLVPGADRKSATLTARLAGSAEIRATSGSLAVLASKVLTIVAGPPATVAASGGTPQSTRIGAPFPARFSASVRDAAGNPIKGIQVTWSSPASGAGGFFAAGGSTAATDSSGVGVAGIFTANTVAGTYSVTATVPGVSVPARYELTNLVGMPVRITPVAGSLQSTTVNTAFPTSLQASVKDSSGNGVDGAVVTFRAPASGPGGTFAGGLLTASVAAANGGIAIAPLLVANSIAGSFSVGATVDGVSSPALFELTNTPGTAGTISATAGTPQSTQVGSVFPVRLAVVLKDGSGNLVAGAPVTFAAPSAGPGGNFAHGRVDTVRTDAGGTAIASPLSANTVAGAFTVYASAPGVATPAAFLLTSTSAPVDTFLIEAAGGGPIGGQTAQVPFTFRVSANDQYGNRATQFTGTVDITSNGVFSQGGNTSEPFAGGLLSSHSVTMQNAGRFTIMARRTGGAETGQTDTFQVINPVPMIEAVSPSNGRRGETLDIIIKGWGFIAGVTTVSFGDRMTTSTTVNSPGQITVTLTIDTAAVDGPRDVIVFNSQPGGGYGTLTGGFVVGSNPLPVLSSVDPDRAGLLQRLNLTLSGDNFLSGVTHVNMGPGILVNAVAVHSAMLMTADVSISESASGGTRQVYVTNDPPGGGRSDSVAFSIELPLSSFPQLSFPPDSAIGVDTSVTFHWHPWLAPDVRYHLQVSPAASFTNPVFDDSTITDTSLQVTSLISGASYYWRVGAWNDIGRSQLSPVRAFTTMRAYPASYAVVDSVFFPSHTLKTAYEPSDYRLIGLPGDSRLPISGILTGKEGVDWAAYWDNGASSNYLESFNGSSTFTCVPGRAFWILHKGPVMINRVVSTATLDSSRCVQIPLHPGWNLITNPFLGPVSWSAVRLANTPGIIADPWGYEGGFVRAVSLLTSRGYLFDNADGRTTLRIPFAGAMPKGLFQEGQWRIPITLTSGPVIDRAACIGIVATADAGRDPLDLRMPRGVGGSPGVFFNRPGWDPDGSVFASDIRPEFTTMEIWPLEVRATIGQPAHLSFDGVLSVPERFRVFLIDDEQRRTLDLRTSAVYRFTPSIPISHFRLVVGTEHAISGTLADVLPKEFLLGQNFPNPFNPSTTIPIEVPRAGAVSLEIYTILGERVRTLLSGPLAAGRHLVHWDGTTDHGQPVSSGVFFIRFENEAGKTSVRKMLLLR